MSKIVKKGKKRPDISAYYGTEAEEYARSQWMARNQQATTERAVQLLKYYPLTDHPSKNETIEIDALILDIGCGTGYSSAILTETGFNVIGIDRSRDMLQYADSECARSLIQADMRAIPLRTGAVQGIISISAFNFASDGAHSREDMSVLIKKACLELARVLQSMGRCAIEFYPSIEEETFFLQHLKSLHFIGGMIIDSPSSKKEHKFLVLQHP